jgi:hypothetical protein
MGKLEYGSAAEDVVFLSLCGVGLDICLRSGEALLGRSGRNMGWM